MIEGEGAGKGDTYRPVNRKTYCANFDEIDWAPEGTITNCECGAEKVKVGPEWLCLSPECSHLNSYHGLVVGYNFALDK